MDAIGFARRQPTAIEIHHVHSTHAATGRNQKQIRRFIRPTSTLAHRRFFIRIDRSLDASKDAEVHLFFLAGEAALSDRLRYKARKGNDNDREHREVDSCDALRAENHQGSTSVASATTTPRRHSLPRRRRRRPYATGRRASLTWCGTTSSDNPTSSPDGNCTN